MRHHLKMIVLGLGMMVGGAGAISATGATSPVEHQYTLEEIKAGLAAGAAQFSHATFHYTMQFAATNVIDGVFQQTGTYDAHILYARDVATNSELYDTQVTYTPLKKGAAAIPSPLGIPTTQPDVVVLDRLWVYDGKNTTVLIQKSEAELPRPVAYIAAGEERATLPHGMRDPYRTVWTFMTIPYARLIKDATLKIEDQNDQSCGVRAVRLSGRLWDRMDITVWVAPEMDFMPMKVVTKESSRGSTSTYTDYKKLEDGPWIPQRIKLDGYNKDPQTITVPTLITIQDVSVKPIPAAFFKPALPVGTVVTDSVAKKTFRVEKSGMVEMKMATTTGAAK